MARGVDGDVVQYARGRAGDRVYLGNAVYLVPEELYAYGFVVGIDREDLHGVAPDEEHIAVEGDIVALITYLDELFQQLVPVLLLAGAQGNDHAGIVYRVAEAVDAGDGGHDDNVPPLRQAGRRRVAQALYLVVYGAVLLNVGVRCGYIGLGLVVVVVGDEVFHGVIREKLAELRTELGCERLVMRQHQRRALDALYDLGHGIGLAGAGDAQQSLLGYTALQPIGQGVYRLGLVAGWHIAADHVKIRHDYSFFILYLNRILAQPSPLEKPRRKIHCCKPGHFVLQ